MNKVIQFEEMGSQEIIRILDSTIKHDEENKLITFISLLSAFTEEDQLNISFNAPSSTGKSYIPLEIARLFPDEDVIKLAGCSPTAFFHEQGVFDKKNKTHTIDLSRKIIIFTDQPDQYLLAKLRSILSHDQKESVSKITDKGKSGANRTKTVIIKGFPAVVFCSAGLKVDEQEATRLIMLSPEISQEKLKDSIQSKLLKEADREAYQQKVDTNRDRILLKERILAIKEANVTQITIPDHDQIYRSFLENNEIFRPRHQRDIGRIACFIKMFALFNLWNRYRVGNTVVADGCDIKEGLALWMRISRSQNLGLSPCVLKIYEEAILRGFHDKNSHIIKGESYIGLSRNDMRMYYQRYSGNTLRLEQLNHEILPALQASRLITIERDVSDKRSTLIYPTNLNDKSI